MKIGLLTVPFNNNYGGFLQAFALKKILEERGHKVCLIRRKRNRSIFSPIVLILKNIIKKYIFRHPNIIIFREKRIRQISVNTLRFQQQYLMPQTRAYYTSMSLKKCLKYKFDFYIVGSDQVWRQKYAKGSIRDYFFDFLDGSNIPRISYGASFGVDKNEFTKEQIERCSFLLKQFKSVSVREISGINIIHNNFIGLSNLDVKLVLDPTMLLNASDYDKLTKSYRLDKQSKGESQLFCYILDINSEIQSIIDMVESKFRIKPFFIKAQTNFFKSKIEVLPPVEQWISSIKNSRFIITDSFHGIVFSIIYNKPFVVYANKERGVARCKSLLSLFNLNDRLVYSLDDILKIDLDKINWIEINRLLLKLRKYSIHFLETALNSL